MRWASSSLLNEVVMCRDCPSHPEWRTEVQTGTHRFQLREPLRYQEQKSEAACMMVFMTPVEQVPLIKDGIDELLARFDDDTMLVLNQFRIDLGGCACGRSAEDRRWFLEKVLSDIKDRLLIDPHSDLLGDPPLVTIAPGTETR